MACCHQGYYAPTQEGDGIFEVDPSRVRYGAGALAEVGDAARQLGMRRAALFVDRNVARLPFAQTVRDALRAAGVDAVEYNEIEVEPTDASFRRAAAFAAEGAFDGYVSLGGGSTMDTCKAADLYATYPADFMAYVNAPIGGGLPIPGPLKPHIACPTTCGTGSECTGMAIFDLLAMKAKTGIASRNLKPTLGIIDPQTTATLPAEVVACSAFDVLSHALESYTARPHTRRPRPRAGQPRPLSQGANPFSDIACLEALRVLGAHIVRAVRDPSDGEARERMMFAAMLAGIGFGNAGCHAPHGMSYAVSGLVKSHRVPGYPPDVALIPHGMSVIVNAPAVFRFTAPASPERHLFAARQLQADAAGAAPEDAGEVLAERIVTLMKATGMPGGLAALEYGAQDLDALTAGALPQRRLLDNSPVTIGKDELHGLFAGALRYW